MALRNLSSGKRRTLIAKGNAGSLLVEAAIIIPLFLVVLAALVFRMNMLATEEKIAHSLLDETAKIAGQAKIVPFPLSFAEKTKQRLAEENPNFAKGLDVSLLYRLPSISLDSLDSGLPASYSEQIQATAEYEHQFIFNLDWLPKLNAQQKVVARAFVGKSNAGRPMSRAELEKATNSTTVYVFPRSGQKYHSRECRYVANEPLETLLSPALKSKFKPCKVCHPDEAGFGALIYCFHPAGEVYHLGTCSHVDKYIVEMEKEEAEERGYQPCSVCGGGK